MITSVTGTNIKGRNFHLDLAPLTVLFGENFTGKTAVLDAIRLAILGYVPELGKTNKASFLLAGGGSTELEANVTMFDGKSFFKKLSASKTSVSQSGSPSIELPLLSPSDFFGMTATARREYVVSRFVSKEPITPEAVIASLEQVSFGGEHTEEIEEAKNDCLSAIKDLIPAGADNLTESIAAALDFLAKEYTVANSRYKDTAGAIRTLVELKVQESGNENPDILTKKMADLQDEISKLHFEAGEMEGRMKNAAGIQRRIGQLKSILMAPYRDWDAALAGMIVPAMPSGPTKADLDAAENQCRELQTELLKIAGDKRSPSTKLAEAKKALADLDCQTKCPFCHSSGPGWDATIRRHFQEVFHENTGKLTALEKAEQSVRDQQKESETALKKLQEDVAKVAHLLEERKEIEAKRAAVEKMRDEDKKNREQAEKELDGIVQEFPPTEKQLEQCVAKRKTLEINLAELKERLAGVQKIQHDIQRSAQAAEANRRHEAERNVIKELGKALKVWQAKIETGVMEEMVECANKLASRILVSPLAFHEGEIGRWDAGTFINHLTFSGTEKAVAYSAVAAALSAQSPYKIMLVDEASRLAGPLLRELLFSLQNIVEAGVIQQAIVVVPTSEFSLEPWKAIKIQTP